MKTHQIVKITKSKKRLARGLAGKGGMTAGRGTKGQRSRTSRGNIPRGFEGGQTSLKMRLPKNRGFNNIYKKEYQIVNVSELSNKFKENDKVDPKKMLAKGILKDLKNPVKILGDGEIKIKLEVNASKFSKSAAEKITKAGGKVNII